MLQPFPTHRAKLRSRYTIQSPGTLHRASHLGFQAPFPCSRRRSTRAGSNPLTAPVLLCQAPPGRAADPLPRASASTERHLRPSLAPRVAKPCARCNLPWLACLVLAVVPLPRLRPQPARALPHLALRPVASPRLLLTALAPVAACARVCCCLRPRPASASRLTW